MVSLFWNVLRAITYFSDMVNDEDIIILLRGEKMQNVSLHLRSHLLEIIACSLFIYLFHSISLQFACSQLASPHRKLTSLAASLQVLAASLHVLAASLQRWLRPLTLIGHVIKYSNLIGPFCKLASACCKLASACCKLAVAFKEVLKQNSSFAQMTVKQETSVRT